MTEVVRLVEREAGAEKAPEEERLELVVPVLSGKQTAMEISRQDMLMQEALLEPQEGKEAGSDPGGGWEAVLSQ